MNSSAFVLTALLTGAVRKLALLRGVLDVPIERSSHTRTTPRGGGASIVLVVSAALILLRLRGTLDQPLFLALLGGGTAVAVVGFLDDRAGLPAAVRLAVHLAAAILAVICLGGLPPLRIGDQLVHLGWEGQLLAVLGIVWTLNLFNFMDGIDGLAPSEALFIACAGGMLALGGPGGVPAAAGVFACSCAGFLIWNWPPAKIFLGDVGSGYLGYVIAVLALGASNNSSVAIWAWLILGGVFFVDATVTLASRVLRGERVQQAHRTHAYQWLARRWRSHRRVTVTVLLINVLWLLPCAQFAALHPSHASTVALVALAPLVVIALAAGAGRRETPEHTHIEA